MKTCEKCGNQFPFIVIINGKHRNLNSRKFCLSCSPFMCHNTKNLNIPQTENKKNCSKCNEEKYLDEFYLLKNDKRSSYCITCNRQQNKIKPREIKIQCVDYKGGKCQICGYDKYLGSLDFHHIDSNTKDFSIGMKHLCSFEELKKELDKCILVCKNCHYELHGNITALPDSLITKTFPI